MYNSLHFVNSNTIFILMQLTSETRGKPDIHKDKYMQGKS